MNISDDFMKELIKSIHSLYSLNTSEEDRNYSINFTAEFLNHPSALEISFSLIDPINDPIVRYYGLSTIEHYIKNSVKLGDNNEIINNFSREQKDFISNTLIEHIQKIEQDDPLHLKKKLSAIMVELLKYQLFDSKENLVPFILSIVPADSYKVEIILTILRIFIEDIENLPKNQWKIAIDNIIDSMPDKLLPYMYYLINNHFTQFKESNLNSSRSIIVNCLMLIQSISEAEWIPASILKDYESLMGSLSYLLSDPQFRSLTSEVLVGIFSKFIFNKPDIIKYLIELANISEQEMQSLNVSDPNESIKYIQRLSQSIAILASSFIADIHLTFSMEDIESIISIIGSMSRHPSLIVSNFALSFWGTLLSSQSFYESSSACEIIKSILFTYMENLKVWAYKDVLPDEKHHIFRINEFFTEEEYLSFMNKYYINFKNFIFDSLTKFAPEFTMKLLIENIEDIIKKMNSFNNIDTNTIDILFLTFYKKMIKNISTFMNGLVELKSHLNLIKAYYERILNINSNISSVVHFQIQFIYLNLSYLQLDPSILEMAIFKMLNFIGFSNNQPIVVDEATKHKACSKLIQIGKKLSSKLVNLCPMITNLIMESNIQDQYTYEKMNIFLISISNSLPLNQLKKTLDSVLSNYIEKWTSNDLQEALSSFDKFVQFFYLNDLSNPNGIETRKQFTTLLNMFKSIWLSVSIKLLKNINEPHPLFDKDLIILENIFNLIKYTHYILSDEGCQIIGFNSIKLSIDPKSATQWIKNEYILNENELELNKFISPLRLACYTIVGKASGHCSHIFEQYLQSLIPSISFYMDQIDIFSWKFIYDCIFKNLFINALEDHYGDLLKFFEYSINCFKAKAITTRTSIMENNLNGPIEEIILSNSLVYTTESFLDFVEKTLFRNEKSSKLFLLIAHEKVTCLIESIAMILEWNNASLTKQCCKIINAFIQLIQVSCDSSILFQFKNTIRILYSYLLEIILKAISGQVISIQRRMMSIILELYIYDNEKFKEILQKLPRFTSNEFAIFESKAKHKNKVIKIRAVRILLERLGIINSRQKVLDIPPSDFVEYTIRRANLKENFQYP